MGVFGDRRAIDKRGLGSVAVTAAVREIAAGLPNNNSPMIPAERGIANGSSVRLGAKNERVSQGNPRDPLNGIIDELRISTGDRGDSWHEAQFRSVLGEMVSYRIDY